MFLNAESVAVGQLGAKLTEEIGEKKERIVLIKADRDVDYGTVMGAMDALREAGIENIGLITDPMPQAATTASGGR